MTRQQTIEQILARLRTGGNILIASHLSPDGDSIGSQLAIYDLCARLGSRPMIVNHDPALPKYAFLRKAGLINHFPRRSEYPAFDTAIILEAPDCERIGDVRRLIGPNCTIINIDHHPGNGQYGQINFIDESVSAVGILVYDMFQAAKLEPSRDNADELFTCILTDTGRFRFSSTNPRAMRVCAHMLELGTDTKRISDALFASFPENQLRMLGALLSEMEIHHNGGSCLMLSNQNMRRKFAPDGDELEGLSEYLLYPAGVKVGALLREIDGSTTKVSFRSQLGYDVAAVASLYGGGGHRNAAGCHLNLPLAEARQKVLTHFGEMLANG